MAPKAKQAARRAKAKAKAKTGGKARNAARIEYFRGTVGLVPWAGKAVSGGWCRGEGRQYREVGTVGRKGGTVGGDVVQIVVVPWGWYFRGTVEMVPWEVVLC